MKSPSHPERRVLWFCECEVPDFDGIECRKCFRCPRWAHTKKVGVWTL